MSLDIGSIKTFTLITGMEVIGKIVGLGEGYFEVEGAFAVNLQPDPSGKNVAQVSLAQLSPFESNGISLELYKSTILISTDPPSELVDQFNIANGSIVVPNTPKVQIAH